MVIQLAGGHRGVRARDHRRCTAHPAQARDLPGRTTPSALPLQRQRQPTHARQADIELLFRDRGQAHFTQTSAGEHGRIETRRIWCDSALNEHVDFPHVGQVFLIERERIEKKTGQTSLEIALGITSRSPEQASPEQVLKTNRAHWCIENSCHYALDWNYDEDRGRIRTGFGPENVSRLRRFAIGLIKSSTQDGVAQKMRQLCKRPATDTFHCIS